MSDERPTTSQPLESSNAPATKADLARLWEIIEARLTEVTARLATKESVDMVQQTVDNLADHLGTFREEVQGAIDDNRNHFDVAVEHIRAELEGANRDEISGLQDGVKALGVRVAALEEERPVLR